jgi:hypothetical protein
MSVASKVKQESTSGTPLEGTLLSYVRETRGAKDEWSIGVPSFGPIGDYLLILCWFANDGSKVRSRLTCYYYKKEEFNMNNC